MSDSEIAEDAHDGSIGDSDCSDAFGNIVGQISSNINIWKHCLYLTYYQLTRSEKFVIKKTETESTSITFPWVLGYSA